jgi:hypothetical protein
MFQELQKPNFHTAYLMKNTNTKTFAKTAFSIINNLKRL